METQSMPEGQDRHKEQNVNAVHNSTAQLLTLVNLPLRNAPVGAGASACGGVEIWTEI